MFNVEQYIALALDSVISQTIGFAKHVEVIVVDDGSTDGSVNVVERYRQEYPDNIHLYRQGNCGVSAARNLGLKHARGKYVNFFDADDLWQKDAYKKLTAFLSTNPNIDIVAARVKFFDRSIDAHPLDYKFKKTRIIDLDVEPDNPLMHIISTMIRRSAVIDRKFDEGLVIAEDAKLLNEILVVKRKYGVVSSTQYNYRKRGSANSAIDTGKTRVEYYLVTPSKAYESLARTWGKSGKLHPYMQHLLLYDLSFRIGGAPYKLLTESQDRQYAKVMNQLLNQIEPAKISASRWYNEAQKRYLLQFRSLKNPRYFGCDVLSVTPYRKPKSPILSIIFNWRFAKAKQQFIKLRRYNLTQLSIRSRLIECAKPWLIIAESVLDIPRALLIRGIYIIAKKIKTKELWIISDRVMAAGDNGEAFFRFLQQKNLDVDIVFAISKKSEDYRRIQAIGNVVGYGSLHYLVKFLLADKVISSHADIETTNPFIRNLDHYQDLMQHKFIFLQHGVISNDLSGWLNKAEKRIDLFITSSEVERDSIVKNRAYGYTDNEVVVTGLARWDLLENIPKDKLIIAPTFRASLLTAPANKNGVRAYDRNFKNTDYFKFYNALLGDKRIHDALARKSMTGEFYLHPNFSQQIQDFNPGGSFKIASYPYDYRSAVSEGNLLVSDYSSVCYDFAYLYKPVIYAQFDSENFYKGHSYSKGYFFDYTTDGFGPVTNTYEETVKQIVAYIESGCLLDGEYKRRIKRYFYKIDQQNRQRILDAIIKH